MSRQRTAFPSTLCLISLSSPSLHYTTRHPFFSKLTVQMKLHCYDFLLQDKLSRQRTVFSKKGDSTEVNITDWDSQGQFPSTLCLMWVALCEKVPYGMTPTF